MNAQVLLGILNAILAIIPSITNSKVINQIVAWLLQIEPTIVQFASDVGPVISNIVAAFAANPATTASQLAVLKQLDATVDQAFDDAFTAYLANHPDSSAAPTSSTVSSTTTTGTLQAASAGAGASPLASAG